MVRSPTRWTWLAAAEKVLCDADRPLAAVEIARLAIGVGMVPARGYTPEHSIQAAIARDLKRGRGPDSPVIHAGKRGAVQLYWHRGRAGV